VDARERGEGIAFLTERMSELERERDALLLKSQRLERLQHSFVDITAAADESALAAAALRAAWIGLGFGRVLWFAIADEPELTALLELDGNEVVESEYGGTVPSTSSLVRIAHGSSDAATGRADDADAPLFDTRHWYVAAAVRPRDGESFVLYADGSQERAPSSWAIASLQEIAAQATFALDNMRMAVELERLALHDPLTGLYNRRALMDRLATELATVRRTGETLAFAMIDVDDFKSVNDTLGHAGGDEALQRIANVLRALTRETDVPARFAGDEFSLIMPRTDRAGCVPVLDRLVAALREASLSCSIGVGFTVGELDVQELFAAADEAVYETKKAGKNGYRLAR
jgi:diguanylate cyclase (GGDEF)-like protein